MARAPSSPGKTRLASHLPPATLGALRRALVADTLATVCAVSGVVPVVFVTPDTTADEVGPLAPRALPVVAQQGADLGARMRHAVEHLIVARNCSAGILIGTDIPLLTAAHIEDAASALRSGSELVLGPAADGGYYLIGVTRVIDEVFDAIEWGTNRVLSQTIAIAHRVGITARTIATLYDVDTIDDLRRVERDLRAAPPAIAPALRDFVASLA
jgi:rSAM/selenodomain-associated transferase 1